MFENFLVSNKQKLIEQQMTKIGHEVRIKPTFYRGWSQVIYKSYPKIEGQYKGRELIISMRSAKRNKKRVFFTKVTVGLYNHYQYDLHLSKETLITKLGTFFGVKDIEVGHPPFDDAYRVKSSDTYFPKEVLGKRDVVQSFTQLSTSINGVFILEGHELSYEERFTLLGPGDRKHLKAMLRLCHQLCQHIEGFAEQRRPVEGGKLRDL